MITAFIFSVVNTIVALQDKNFYAAMGWTCSSIFALSKLLSDLILFIEKP
jgi:hypothetical protein